MRRFFSQLFSLLKIILALLFIGGISYYIIDKIQEKNNLMDIEEYSPKSTLIVPETTIKRAKFPFIDVHNHQFDMPLKDLSKLTAEMDSLNMAFMINLSGLRGLYLQQSLKNVKENAPTRFGLFVNIDFETIDEADFAAWTDKKAGPINEKITKKNVKTILMTGTNSDRAVTHYKNVTPISVTYPELLVQKKEVQNA